jgi:HD superfamily phosphohydrolase
LDYSYKIFGDEVLGFVGVSENELKIIESTPFQRLRRVMQLDVANLVYPNAMHNRFTHSLGVMYLSTRMAEEALDWKSRTSGKKVNPVDRARIIGELRILSLIHDVGHYALSHCGENALHQVDGPEDAHESFGKILAQSEIMRDGLEEAADECGSNYNQIITAIQTQREDPRFVFQILDSHLDSDKMDYLIRDSYHTGVACGIFERERLFRMLRCVEDTLTIDPRGENAIESYLLARYEMYNQVYLHKTVSCFRGIAEKILTYFIQCKLLPNYKELLETPQRVDDVDDFSFFSLVHKAAKGTLFDSNEKEIPIEEGSIEGLQYLAKHLVWRERIPQAFHKSLFNSPQYLKIMRICDEYDKNSEFSSYLERSEDYDTFVKKLEDNKFDDEFEIICSKNNLPPDSVIVKIEEDITIPPIIKRVPSRKDEYTKAIILLPKEKLDDADRPESIADLISGSSMRVFRVFAPREIKEEIRKLLEGSYGE